MRHGTAGALTGHSGQPFSLSLSHNMALPEPHAGQPHSATQSASGGATVRATLHTLHSCAPYTRVHTFTYSQSPTGGVARHPSVLYAGHGRSLCTLVATIFARFPTGGVARHPNVRRSWRLREGRRGTQHAHTAQSISILRSHTHARGGVSGIGVCCLLAVSAQRGCGL